MNPLKKLSLDLGPLVIFLVSYYALDVYWATGLFIGATLIAGGLSYSWSGKISPLMLFSGAFVVILGGLTIWLQNDVFIKLKPTIYYVCVSVLLTGGLVAKRLVIKDLMEFAVKLTEDGWRILTQRLVIFFLVLGALNVWVAFTFSFDVWLWFKILGFTGLSFAFFLSQSSLFERYEIKDDEQTAKTA
jgi:intracellular septation protein